MIYSTNRTISDARAVLKLPIFDSNGRKLAFEDVLNVTAFKDDKSCSSSTISRSCSCDSRSEQNSTLRSQHRVLVIFVRHFFCGNCQEYIRCLTAHPLLSAANLLEHKLSIVVVGCGMPSLISSYRAITNTPESWTLYADPSTKLYEALGMHKSLSMGDHNPRYIRRSLAENMLASIMQGVRRIPEGDVRGAGSWKTNGGEFLFEWQEQAEDWKLVWCHRMRNSRDHTEVDELSRIIGLGGPVSVNVSEQMNSKTTTGAQSSSVASGDDSILHEKLEKVPSSSPNTGLRRSLSVRRQSWVIKTSALRRSLSIRVRA